MSALTASLVATLAAATALAVAAAARRPHPRRVPRRPGTTDPSVDVSGRDVRRRRTATLVVVGSALTLLVGPLPVVTVLAVALGGRSVRHVAAARRRRRAIEAALPDVADLLVLTMHAGLTPARAVVDVAPHTHGPVRSAFDAVALRLQRGQRLADAVGALPELLGPRASGLADAIATSERYGLPLAPVLQSLADDARADRRRAAEAAARSLSVKLSFPLVVCTLPSFVLLAIVPAVMGALRSLPTSGVGPPR